MRNPEAVLLSYVQLEWEFFLQKIPSWLDSISRSKYPIASDRDNMYHYVPRSRRLDVKM
jgi:hypothetical protein